MAAYASPRPAPAPSRVSGLLIATTVGAALLVLFGLLCLLLYLSWPLLERGGQGAASPDDAIAQAAEFGVLAVYGLGVGAALLWQAVRAWRGAPGRRFHPGLGLALLALLLFPVAIVAGVAALGLPHRAAGYLFPLPALIAVLAPPLLVISLVQLAGWARGAPATGEAGAAIAAPATLTGRISREDPFAADLVRRVVGLPTTRRVLGALAWGLAGASLIAIVLELVAMVAGLLVGGLALSALGQSNELNRLVGLVQDSTGMDCTTLRSVVGNPLVLLVLIGAFAGVAPLIEEPAKSLAVVWLRGRLAVPRDALLYGAAAGVGFGMLESAVYNVGDVHSWWSTATLRLGTTFIHALATGMFGVAWFYRLQRHDRRRFRRYALASLATHGLWNASVIGIIGLSVVRVCSTDSLDLLTSNDPYRYVVVLVPGILMAGAALALFALARRLGPAEPSAAIARIK